MNEVDEGHAFIHDERMEVLAAGVVCVCVCRLVLLFVYVCIYVCIHMYVCGHVCVHGVSSVSVNDCVLV